MLFRSTRPTGKRCSALKRRLRQGDESPHIRQKVLPIIPKSATESAATPASPSDLLRGPLHSQRRFQSAGAETVRGELQGDKTAAGSALCATGCRLPHSLVQSSARLRIGHACRHAKRCCSLQRQFVRLSLKFCSVGFLCRYTASLCYIRRSAVTLLMCYRFPVRRAALGRHGLMELLIVFRARYAWLTAAMILLPRPELRTRTQ